MLSAANCLLIRVNNHASHWDGSICPNPLKHNCGAYDWFKERFCMGKARECYDHSLFSPETPSFRKRGKDVDKDGFFTQAQKAMMVKRNPIFLFYHSPGAGRNYLSGLYVVGAILSDGDGDSFYSQDTEYHVQAMPDRAIRFVVPNIDNSILWTHSIGSGNNCRRIHEPYVITGLRTIVDKHIEYQKQLNIQAEEREECEQVIEHLNELINDLAQSLGQDNEEAMDGVITPQLLAQLKTSLEGGGKEKNSFRPTMGRREPSPAPTTVPPTVPPTIAPKSSLDQQRVMNQGNFKHHDIAEGIFKIVNNVKMKSEEQGLYYSDDLIMRYHLSLLTKPFVILAGVSGGGKTHLAMSYAEACDGKLLVVSVRPDWSDNQSLLGSYDLLNCRFMPTPFSEFLLQAAEDYKKTGAKASNYYVVLDEMNLARVEYYFSDFLSKMELAPGHRKIRFYDNLHVESGEGDHEFPQDVEIPPNLFITGTVNVDETTHAFSAKVLDRANFIRLDEINLDEMLALFRHWTPPLMVQEVAARTVEVLKDINTILRGCGQQFGYRTAREIIRWVDLAVASGMDPNSALDVQIEQKVLVKVQGSRSNKAERSMLDTLFSYLGDREGSASGNLALPRCYNRVQHMLETLKEDDFAFGQY